MDVKYKLGYFSTFSFYFGEIIAYPAEDDHGYPIAVQNFHRADTWSLVPQGLFPIKTFQSPAASEEERNAPMRAFGA